MKKKLFKIWSIAWRTAVAAFALSLLLTVVYRFVPVPFTILMLQRCGEQAIQGEPLALKKDWVALNEMPNCMPLAVVASEDQNFLSHNGFDFQAIEKAMKYNEKQKKKKRPKTKGASTISQQTAKNVFLWPARSWVRKGFEVYFTALIELLWSKERIIEVYLNVAEMGNGIYGVEAASQYYFHKQAAKITPQQAALLAAVLPNPRKYNAGKPSAFVLKRQAWILRQMGMFGGVLDFSNKEGEAN
jgi:monofunctional biosynthetic peptidoglycan transglycosylase